MRDGLSGAEGREGRWGEGGGKALSLGCSGSREEGPCSDGDSPGKEGRGEVKVRKRISCKQKHGGIEQNTEYIPRRTTPPTPARPASPHIAGPLAPGDGVHAAGPGARPLVPLIPPAVGVAIVVVMVIGPVPDIVPEIAPAVSVIITIPVTAAAAGPVAGECCSSLWLAHLFLV